MRKKSAGYIYRAMTLAEVAAELGVTSERVRQIETNALYKIRVAMKARGINAEMLLPPDYEEARA